jgi:hypothetical protein
MHEHVRYEPLRHQPVEGFEGIERLVAEMPEAEREAEVTPLVLLERDETVLVLLHARIAHEHLAAAWMFEVRDSRIAYVKTFGDWTQAQSAAGFAADDGHLERRLVSS